MAITADQIEGQQRLSRRWPAWTVLLLVAAVIVLAGVSTKFGLDIRANVHDDERDRAALAAANRIAAQLVTLNHSSAQQNLKAIATDSTGSFRDQWEKISGNFASVLENGKVESTGKVEESGIVEIDDSRAIVLAAVTSTVKNTEAPEGQQRVYRMKMTLDHSDGRWLVSNVEFVA
ncbi:hypothetical protein [Nocardia sp. R7R-8]|uniref:hypothetical protein n=1 Tax=Nocardia sp. R7R-8 TaxID=3459304 RepID=UPI00403E15E5